MVDSKLFFVGLASLGPLMLRRRTPIADGMILGDVGEND